MSTAWYKSRVVPKLLHQWGNNNNTTGRQIVEVWNTTCIVTNFGKSTKKPDIDHEDDKSDNSQHRHHILINPANPQLSGVSQFPYFPRGGPVPKKFPSKDSHPIMGYVTQYGGMDVGDGMLFSANVVDGLVHQLGGSELALECQQIGTSVGPHSRVSFFKMSPDIRQLFMSTIGEWIGVQDKLHLDTAIRCPEGHAVSTSPGGSTSELARQYDQIIHTVTPFYKNASSEFQDSSRRDDGVMVCNDKHHHDPERILQLCYTNSMEIATNRLKLQHRHDGKGEPSIRVACPLLGAGCKGFPIDVAISVAASSAVEWLHGHDRIDTTLAFGIPEPVIADLLIEAIENEIGARSS